jgi:nucleotide-binding universal stress UspA family protein
VNSSNDALPPYRSIVVGVDDSEGARRAAWGARALGLPLHLFRADLGIDDVADSVKAEVAALAAELDATWSTAPLGQAPGDPARLIEAAVVERGGAIACLGSHGRRAVASALLGSTTNRYLARSGRPALLYGPGASDRGEAEPEQVALCVDGSEHAASLLGEAARWSAGLSVPLVVVSASSAAPAAHDHELEAEADVRALEARARDAGLAVTGVVVEGRDPRAELIAFLDARPTLGVLATHGRSGLGATVLGGTAGAVVRNARGPLLLRRPPGLPEVG